MGAHSLERQLVDRALARDPAALRELVAELTPTVQVRVARTLLRSGRAGTRDARQEVSDLVQDVFALLFADDGHVLRTWAPERGLSLKGFVGFVAERQCAAMLRTARRSPWTEDPTLDGELDRPDETAFEARIESREVLVALLARAKEVLSPLGAWLFQLLLVEQRPAPEVCQATGMSRDAVYAWQSRLTKVVRALRAELEKTP